GGGRGGRGGGGGKGGSAAPAIQADAEASLPLIIEQVKQQMTADKKSRIQDRAAKHARANHEARVAAITQAVESKRAGWDGDLNYAPGVLWTAAHHRLPMLTVMHNNRAWHQEYMFVEYMAGVRGRGGANSHIGSTLRDPFIDYAKMAAGYGMAAEGPITDPTK